MNIIKQIFETPDTPSGKKRLNNLITRLGLGKKVKGDLMKDVVSGELGGGASDGEVKEWYYKDNSNDINLPTMLAMLGVRIVLCKYRDNGGVGEAAIDNIIHDEYGYNKFYQKYFKLSTLDTCNGADVGSGDDGIDNCYFNPYNNLYSRIDDLGKLSQDVLQLKDFFVEVSKEEYESKITYRNQYTI